jgi:hypothetical protein
VCAWLQGYHPALTLLSKQVLLALSPLHHQVLPQAEVAHLLPSSFAPAVGKAVMQQLLHTPVLDGFEHDDCRLQLWHVWFHVGLRRYAWLQQQAKQRQALLVARKPSAGRRSSRSSKNSSSNSKDSSSNKESSGGKDSSSSSKDSSSSKNSSSMPDNIGDLYLNADARYVNFRSIWHTYLVLYQAHRLYTVRLNTAVSRLHSILVQHS